MARYSSFNQQPIIDPLPIGSGGTGAVSASAARIALDVVATGSQRYQPSQNWRQANVAASQTDVQLSVFGGAFPINHWSALRAGAVTGIAVDMDIPAAGSGITFKVFKNGVATAATISLIVGEAHKNATFADTVATFAATDHIDVRVTTPVGWTATTANVLVTLEVTA